MTADAAGHTQGTLLDGRLRYAQPRDGYRTGIEPVLLAATVPAHPGQRVLEAGCGAGAGLLCLLRRVPDVSATGIELEPGMAALARANLAANGLDATIVTADVTHGAGMAGYDHAFANPPWHDPAGTRPPDGRRALATHGGGLASWVGALAKAVDDGSVSLALPAAQVGRALDLLAAAGFGRAATLSLLPKAGRAAKITLVQARRGTGPPRHGPGLVLHEADGRFTPAIEAVLRGGAALPLG